jgi:hypothetical protein
MIMARLENKTKRGYHLPMKEHGTLKFGAQQRLAPNGVLEVPDWYVDSLSAERGWNARLAAGDVVVSNKPAAAARKPETKTV